MTTREQANEMKRLIADYIQANGVTSVREISEYVNSTLGFYPSTGTVAAVLRGLGYVAERQKSFVWRHNPGRHE